MERIIRDFLRLPKEQSCPHWEREREQERDDQLLDGSHPAVFGQAITDTSLSPEKSLSWALQYSPRAYLRVGTPGTRPRRPGRARRGAEEHGRLKTSQNLTRHWQRGRSPEGFRVSGLVCLPSSSCQAGWPHAWPGLPTPLPKDAHDNTAQAGSAH